MTVMAYNQSDKKKNKDILDSDAQLVDHHHLSVQNDTEESKESKLRQKIIFKKLLFLNTKRMLEILKFKPGDAERKKLMKLAKHEEDDNKD